jgi:biotin synthase-like enzyme
MAIRRFMVELMSLAEPPLHSLANPGLIRNDWTRAEVGALFALPFPELVFEAARIHRMHFDPSEVQISTLLSIKTGGCPEDCAYCPQSASYDTGDHCRYVIRKWNYCPSRRITVL